MIEKLIREIKAYFFNKCFVPSNKYYDTEVVVDGNRYRIGFDSLYLSLQNNRTSGWELWNLYPDNPTMIGNEFDNKEFKIYIKNVLIYTNS